MRHAVRVPLALTSVVALRGVQSCSRPAPAALPVLEPLAQAPGAPLVLSPNERAAADATKHIVVLYMQNNSFDKLFGLWDQVNGDPVDNIATAPASTMKQANQDGAPVGCLLINDVNLASGNLAGAPSCDDTSGQGKGRYPAYQSAYPNAPFLLNDTLPAGAMTCPPPGTDASLVKFARPPADNGVAANSPGAQAGGCTRDLVHRAADTLTVVTYDEIGGAWDHVPPPGQGSTTKGAHDEFGPGTRIPTLIVSNGLPRSGVDSTTYDLAPVIGTITAKYGLAPLNRRDSEQASIWSAWSALKK